MLQKYDIMMDMESNRLLIKEFAVIDEKTSKYVHTDPTKKKYELIHEVDYDGDTIRAVSKEGREALIAELRTDDFFPNHSCAKVLAGKVTQLLGDKSELSSEMFFDDRSLFEVPPVE
jgi:hypothetical protein